MEVSVSHFKLCHHLQISMNAWLTTVDATPMPPASTLPAAWYVSVMKDTQAVGGSASVGICFRSKVFPIRLHCGQWPCVYLVCLVMYIPGMWNISMALVILFQFISKVFCSTSFVWNRFAESYDKIKISSFSKADCRHQLLLRKNTLSIYIS